jgi:hypothetical protein
LIKKEPSEPGREEESPPGRAGEAFLAYIPRGEGAPPEEGVDSMKLVLASDGELW